MMGGDDTNIEISRVENGYEIEVPVKNPEKTTAKSDKKGIAVVYQPDIKSKTYVAKTIEEAMPIIKAAMNALKPDGIDDDDMNDKQMGFDMAMKEEKD